MKVEAATPAVAVIIPAYNAAPTLAKTLQSLLVQTMTNFEAVVTDDGSTDSTFELASAFAAQDRRVRVVRQLNSGLADARNSGIHNTRAPLVAALDSDDIWHPTFLAKLLQAFEHGGRDTVIAYANSRIIDMGDRVLRNAPSFHYSGWVFNQLLLQNFIGNGSAMMFRRDLAVQFGAYERRLHHEFHAQGCEDWLLALRLAARGRVAVVPEYLIGYRAVPGAMSENTLRMRRSRLAALRVLFGEIDVADSQAARWAQGTTHAKCFLHEFRVLRVREALRSLTAALRLDFSGTLRLLLGSERVSWLARKIPQPDDYDQIRPFQEFDPGEGQCAVVSSLFERLRWSGVENGPVAVTAPTRKSSMAEVKI
jgi:glycosyltransferase involved in cell wall biosynthesis